MHNSNDDKDENRNSSVHQSDLDFNVHMTENPPSAQSTYDHQNQQYGDQDLYAIIGSDPGSHSTQLLPQETHLPSSNQPSHCPGPQSPPPRAWQPTAHVPAVSGQSSPREVIWPSANVSLNPPAFPHPAQQSTHLLSSNPSEVLQPLIYQLQGPPHDPNSSQLGYRYPVHSGMPIACVPAVQSSQRGVLQPSANVSQTFSQNHGAFSQWGHQYPPRRMGMPTPTPVNSMQSWQIGVIQPSASICGRHCRCAAVLSENAQLRSAVVSLRVNLATVEGRLEKLENEVLLRPSDGELSKPRRARSQGKSPTMKKPPLCRGRRRSLKDDKVQWKSDQKSSQVTATSQPKVVGRLADLFSGSNDSDEATSSNPAAQSPSFLELMQANVGSQGIVFRQRREVVNVVENLNESPPAQAERSQHEEEDDIASTSA